MNRQIIQVASLGSVDLTNIDIAKGSGPNDLPIKKDEIDRT